MRFECFRRKRAIWRRTIPLSHSLEEDGLKAAVMDQNWVLDFYQFGQELQAPAPRPPPFVPLPSASTPQSSPLRCVVPDMTLCDQSSGCCAGRSSPDRRAC